MLTGRTECQSALGVIREVLGVERILHPACERRSMFNQQACRKLSPVAFALHLFH